MKRITYAVVSTLVLALASLVGCATVDVDKKSVRPDFEIMKVEVTRAPQEFFRGVSITSG